VPPLGLFTVRLDMAENVQSSLGFSPEKDDASPPRNRSDGTTVFGLRVMDAEKFFLRPLR
jgi:hypothetical protein